MPDNPATQAGSGPYYVVRFSPQTLRPALQQWFAWFALIDDIAEKASDPGVARLKLDWWRDEAQRMQTKQARHPLAERLQQPINHDWQVTQMRRALDAIERRILRQTPADLDDLKQQCAEQAGSRLKLLCGIDNPELDSLGSFINLIQRLGNLRTDLQNDYLSIPKPLLQAAGISSSVLPNKGLNTELLEGLRPLTEAYDLPALKRMHKNAELRPALRFTAQHVSQLKQLRKHGAGSQQTSPMSNLWSAWRLRN